MFAADAAAFEAALDALPGIPAVVSAGHRDGAEHLSVLMNTNPGEAVRTAFANLSPDGTAKILFTSGSTGAPKGVLNTHRMLAANQQMIRQAWPFLGWEASPASLDAGEITDKGYINQRRVLARRADLVDMLYADPVPAGVVVAERTS